MDPTVRSRLEGMKSQAFALEEYIISSCNQGTTLNDVAQEAAGYAAKELVRSTGLSDRQHSRRSLRRYHIYNTCVLLLLCAILLNYRHRTYI